MAIRPSETCPKHEGRSLSKNGWCNKCRKYYTEEVIDTALDEAIVAAQEPVEKPKDSVLSYSETIKVIATFPKDYRNKNLCPECNPVVNRITFLDKVKIATDQDLDNMTVEQMVVYMKKQFDIPPETDDKGKAVRPLCKRKIINVQSDLGIHRAS